MVSRNDACRANARVTQALADCSCTLPATSLHFLSFLLVPASLAATRSHYAPHSPLLRLVSLRSKPVANCSQLRRQEPRAPWRLIEGASSPFEAIIYPRTLASASWKISSATIHGVAFWSLTPVWGCGKAKYCVAANAILHHIDILTPVGMRILSTSSKLRRGMPVPGG